MTDAPTDEPTEEPGHEDKETGQAPIVAGVGSGAVGSVDLEDEDVEPQRQRHPDNDGETVEG